MFCDKNAFKNIELIIPFPKECKKAIDVFLIRPVIKKPGLCSQAKDSAMSYLVNSAGLKSSPHLAYTGIA